MELQAMLDEKLKILEALRNKLREVEELKQRVTSEALEVQGAAKQLAEIINAQKSEVPAIVPSPAVDKSPNNSKKHKKVESKK